jgi:hypothetical protein
VHEPSIYQNGIYTIVPPADGRQPICHSQIVCATCRRPALAPGKDRMLGGMLRRAARCCLRWRSPPAASRGTGVRQGAQAMSWSPRQESNLYLALRRHLFYPLNYGEDLLSGRRTRMHRRAQSIAKPVLRSARSVAAATRDLSQGNAGPPQVSLTPSGGLARSDRFGGRSKLDDGEIALANVAQRAAPIVRNIGEARACRNTLVRQSLFLVIDPAANQANPAFVFDNVAHGVPTLIRFKKSLPRPVRRSSHR